MVCVCVTPLVVGMDRVIKEPAEPDPDPQLVQQDKETPQGLNT